MSAVNRTKDHVRAKLPPPIVAEKKVSSANGSPRTATPPRDIRGIASETHVGVAENDLVAYEYVNAQQRWQWGLATVAALPAPRLVQLLPWAPGRTSLAEMSPNSDPISPEGHKRTAARMEELLRQRTRVEDEEAALSRRLAVRHAEYTAGRRKVLEVAEAAERTLAEARRRVCEIDACDWREIRSYRTPPPVVVLVMEAVLTVLGERVVSWGQMQMRIRAHDFMHRIEAFDPVKLSVQAKRSVRTRFLENAKFTYADAINGSQALGYLQQWVVAQIATASAAETLLEYDIAHAKERAAMSGLEQQITAFQRALQQYTDEEEVLRARIDERTELAIGYKNGTAHTAGQETEEPNPQRRLGNDNANAPSNNIHGKNNKGCNSHMASDHSVANAASNSAAADADIASVEYIHGTSAVWTYTEEPIVTLRSAILCNYDQPESTVVQLTSDQVAQIAAALRHRGSAWDDEQRAAVARLKLQDALEDLRGRHAHALRRLQEFESGAHDLQRALDDRERELAKLNGIVAESGISLSRLQTPRHYAASQSQHSTPRAGHTDPADLQACAGATANRHSNGVAHSGDEDMDLALRVADLESQLTRALHANPTAAQVQLLEDDLSAVQDELRRTKNELDSFRAAHAPMCFTSTAFHADRAADPAERLEAAQRLIDELEAALEAAQQQLQHQQEQRDSVRQGGGRVFATDLPPCDELVEERLNAELHAHEATRRALDATTRELEALWAQHSDAAERCDKEAAARRVAEEALAGARAAASVSGERRKVRANAFGGAVARLAEEARRQRTEAAAVSSVLEEARKLLGGMD